MDALFQHFTATTPEALPETVLSAFTTEGIYPLWGARLHSERKVLHFAPGVTIECSSLSSGVLRGDSRIKPGMLAIGLAHADMRILGVRVSTSFLGVGAEDSRLNAIILPTSSFLCFVFQPEAAARILDDPERWEALQKPHRPWGARALMRSVNPTGRLLFDHARELLDEAENAARGGEREDIAFRLSLDEVVEMSAECIDEMLNDKQDVVLDEAPGQRLKLAYEVEELLWRSGSPDAPDTLSLDKAAQALGSSRRRIQQAIDEVFGMGFVALKRAIRLHQADALLKEGAQPGEIAKIARAYEFNHLSRFSRYYREFFGVLPSERALGRQGPDQLGAAQPE